MSDAPDDRPPYFGAPGFAESYWFELLYNQPARLDAEALVEQVSAQMPVVVMTQAIDDASGIVSVGYPDRLINVGGTPLPAMTNIAWSNARINVADYKAGVQQTWEWDGARKALSRCWYKLIVGDITGARLPYQQRYARLVTLTAALIRLTDPLVCFWKEASCLVEPWRFEERAARFCNVRQFSFGVGFEHHMDTLGLAAIGLPDIELRFARLEPGRVAAFLYRTSEYLFEKGDIINDGDTVPGPDDTRWKTHHAVATMGPPRTVIKVIPDARYAVG